MLAKVRSQPGRDARAAGELRRHHRPPRHRRRIDADHRARQGARPARRLRERVPGRDAHCSPAAPTGALLAQQTAANLHAKPGDTVTIGRAGGRAGERARRRRRRPARGRLALPAGGRTGRRAAAGAARQRDPAPAADVRRRDARRAGHDAGARRGLAPRCPAARAAPSRRCPGAARNLETRLAGAGLVGDNLGSALDKARQDALYAQLLFLFLGVPGAVLAGVLTASIASAGRRPPPARLRAAPHPRRVHAAGSCASRSAETAVAGGIGVAAGLAGALAIGAAAFGTASFGAGPVAAVAVGGRLRARRARDRRGGDRPARVARRALADRRRPATPRRPRGARVRGGRATGSTSSRSPAPHSSTGRRRATATTWCSRPRASRRCRSTGTRCWRPCSAGSAAAC